MLETAPCFSAIVRFKPAVTSAILAGVLGLALKGHSLKGTALLVVLVLGCLVECLIDSCIAHPLRTANRVMLAVIDMTFLRAQHTDVLGAEC